VLLVSFKAHTCVVGDQEYFVPRATMSTFFHAPPFLWQLSQGKRLPTKGSTRLLPTSVAGGNGDGVAAVVSQAPFRFPSLVAGNDLNLGERWG
jgi:hypothetical protein